MTGLEISMKRYPSRRGFLFASLVAMAAFSPLSSVSAAPRLLTPSPQVLLGALASGLKYDLTGAQGAQEQVFDGYMRLRLPADLLFQPGAESVSRSGIDVLTAIAPRIARENGFRMEIVGHVGGTTHSSKAYIASRRRAEAVKAVLLSRGVPPSKSIITTGLGDLYPIYPNDTRADAMKNARIELIFRPL